MTKEDIQNKKAYLIATTNAKNILFRYGVKIKGNRCRSFCHNSKDYDTKVFHNGIQCFSCGSRMDIFEIVQHFEHCDFWTSFQILGGTDEIDEKTKKKMEEVRLQQEREILLSRNRKQKIAIIVKKLQLFNKLAKEYEPKNQDEEFSEEWCFLKNMIFYWEYLFEYYTEKERC